MRREYLFCALFVSCLLLFGSTQSYVHALSQSGQSYIIETKDLSSYIQSYPEGSLEKMQRACSFSPALGCSVDGTIIMIRLVMASNSGYYTFNADYGIPFITYTITVDKIPSDQFDVALNRVLTAAELTTSSSSAKPLDLRDKEKNAQLAEAWKSVGMNKTYVVVMPNGYNQTHDVITLLEESKPITVTAQEFNLGYIMLFTGIMVLAAFAASFFMDKRKKKG